MIKFNKAQGIFDRFDHARPKLLPNYIFKNIISTYIYIMISNFTNHHLRYIYNYQSHKYNTCVESK